MGWQGSGRLFNPKLLLYRPASSDWESDTQQSPEWQGRVFHWGKIAWVKKRKTPGWNQDVTLGACEVDIKLEGKLLSPNYMAFLPLFLEQDVILWPQPSLILRCFSLLHERSTAASRLRWQCPRVRTRSAHPCLEEDSEKLCLKSVKRHKLDKDFQSCLNSRINILKNLLNFKKQIKEINKSK